MAPSIAARPSAGAARSSSSASSRPSRPILVQEIDHCPQCGFLDVDLEQVGAGRRATARSSQMALLLDGRRLGIALDHDQPGGTWRELAGTSCTRVTDVIPNGWSVVLAGRK